MTGETVHIDILSFDEDVLALLDESSLEYSLVITMMNHASVLKMLVEHMSRCVEWHAPPPTLLDTLQAQADNNKANAETLFGDRLSQNSDGSWVDADGDTVIFTPHGYRKEKEIHERLNQGPVRD